jgi:D-sedoheptulose 7-phosphate isomerase
MDPILTQFDQHLRVVEAAKSMAPQIAQMAKLVTESLANHGTLFLCGNGGSAADSQHIAAEFTGRYLKERRPLPAIALTVNSSGITAVGNDYGYEEVFARSLRALGRRGDVLVAISTSGNSPNVLRAVAVAKEIGIVSIGMTGHNGGRLRESCDLCLSVPSPDTPRIQETHILIGHIMSGLVEDALAQ